MGFMDSLEGVEIVRFGLISGNAQAFDFSHPSESANGANLMEQI